VTTNHTAKVLSRAKIGGGCVAAIRFVEYHQTSLERNRQYELLVPANVGVDVDLVDMSSLLRRPGLYHERTWCPHPALHSHGARETARGVADDGDTVLNETDQQLLEDDVDDSQRCVVAFAAQQH
jgi:hypothetical protein